MTTKQRLKEVYQQYLCELGADHVDTMVAKRLYHNSLDTEQETLSNSAKWIRENVGADVAADFLKAMEK